MLQKTLSRILGCALLLYGAAAPAFTLITIPPATQEQGSASNTITDATTLETQVQPIAGTIRAQLLSQRRPRASTAKSAQFGSLLASNAFVNSRSDLDYLAAAPSGSSGGGNGSGVGGDSESVWISAATNWLENDFYRTAFHGATFNLLTGFDLTRSDKYVAGLAVGFEGSNFVTTFNNGNEKTQGFNVNPYFAFLLSDVWSLDLILGYGRFDTRQTRPLGAIGLGTIPVDSQFESKRGFISTNLTNVSTFGNWRLTGSLGYLGSRREQNAYMESDGTTVAEAKQTSEQWNLLGEAAYGRGNSETFLGALYENTRDPEKIVFASGDQPANDPDSVLLTAGWRHFGKGLTANFMFSTRLAQEQVTEYGFLMMLRIDL